jgi:hypothetical protein
LPDETPTDGGRLELDARSFTLPERVECSIKFDSEFGDLLEYLFAVIDPSRKEPVPTAIVDREGRRYFADEIIAYMLWVQAKRGDPDADPDAYNDQGHLDLQRAHIRGLLKKAGRASTKRRQSSTPPD